MRQSYIWLGLTVALMTMQPALAQSTQPATSQPAPPKVEVIKLTLHPMATTRPALKYALLPNVAERQPGNGAVLYMEGVVSLPPYSAPDGKEAELYNQMDRELDASDTTFSKVQAAKVVDNFSYGFFDEAARRDYAEWGAAFRENGFYTLLPYLNYTRMIANAISLRTRLYIAEGKLAQAHRSMQTIFSMTWQLNRNPFLVQGLVAAGIDRLALRQGVQQWIKVPDAPNLYWPLTNLPDQLVDLHAIADMDYPGWVFTDPRFAQATAGTLPPDQWRGTIEKVMVIQYSIKQGSFEHPSGPSDLSQRYERLAKSIYPLAERQLESRHMSPKQINAIPVDQVVGEYIFNEYRSVEDAQWKGWMLPYPQATPILMKAQREFERIKRDGNPLLEAFGSSTLVNARATFALLQQRVAVLRTIEAIRDYSARHKGQLPASLADVTELPIPNDPVSGRPFDYRCTHGMATINLATPYKGYKSTRYELTIAH